MSPRAVELLLPSHRPSILASAISLAVILLLAGSLRGVRARRFFLCCVLLELLAMAATVHIPEMRHYGLIFASLIIALLIDAYSDANRPQKPWLPRRTASVVMAMFLAIQTLAAISLAGLDLVRPYSEAKEAGLWLKQSSYANNPLLIGRDALGPGLLGYMQRDKAYYSECDCYGSFVIWSAGRSPHRAVTVQEIQKLRQSSDLPVVVVVNRPLDPAQTSSLNLRPLQFFSHRPLLSGDIYFVYVQSS